MATATPKKPSGSSDVQAKSQTEAPKQAQPKPTPKPGPLYSDYASI